MKWIAHRGAPLLYPENSLEGLTYAAGLGAYAVECDLRRTRDGVYILFHDPDTLRLTGQHRAVEDCTYAELCAMLDAQGLPLLTLDQLLAQYNGRAYILLHMKVEPEAALLAALRPASEQLILGVSSLPWLRAIRGWMPKERILAFLPDPHARHAFVAEGAGVVRLWEAWLDEITPRAVLAESGMPVWIMACDPQGSAKGSIELLSRALALGADGVLMDDTLLGAKWFGQTYPENDLI